MANVFSSALFSVNAKNLSSYITDISPNYGSEMLDETAMGDGTRIKKGGLKDWSFDVSFLYDDSTSGPEAVLWGLVGTTVCAEYRNINVCATEGNPIYSGIGVVENFNHGGGVGTLLGATVRIVSAGTLDRAITS